MFEVEHFDDKFVIPPTDAQAERDSFNFQSTAFNDKPLKANKEKILQSMESMLKDYQFKIAGDFLEDTHIRRTICRVVATHGTKSSGARFARMKLQTIADVAAHLGEEGIFHLVKDMLNKLLDPSTDVKYVSEALRAFVKREPHKRSKALQKRWRLIFGMDLVDRIIDELLYHEMLETALKASGKGPLKPGYNFLKGGVDKMVRKYSKTASKSWHSFDAKQHDMTCSEESLCLVRDLNIRLCRSVGSLRDKWEHLVRRREEAVLYGSINFSDGTLIRKKLGGIQPSGRLTTIDSNSKIVLSLRVGWDLERGITPCADESVCMGDDTVFDNIGEPEEFIAYLQERGYNWTLESEKGEFASQNFCSIKFILNETGQYVPVPINWEKNVFNLCHPEKGSEQFVSSALMSLCTLYAYDEEHFPLLHGLLAEHGGDNFRSRSWFRNVVTGVESPGSTEATDALCASAMACLVTASVGA